MANFVDSNELFSKCMTESSHEKLTARTISTYTESPFAVHCEKFAPIIDKDPIPEYLKLLFEKGREHEEQTVSKMHPDATKLYFETMEDGFKQILDSMILGTEIFHGVPIYFMPEGMYGSADIVERSNDASSIFGDYHYTIKEIKLFKCIT